MAKAKKTAKKPLRKNTKAPKAEQVEGADGPMLSLLGGNMPPVKDIIYHLETIAGYEEKAATARSKVTDAKKKAKEAGVDVAAISLAMKLERMDPLDLASKLRQLQVLAHERGLPIQLSLYEPKYGSIEEQGAAEGWQAGLVAKSPDMERWPEGAPGSKEYMRRWNDAQAELVTKGATAQE